MARFDFCSDFVKRASTVVCCTMISFMAIGCCAYLSADEAAEQQSSGDPKFVVHEFITKTMEIVDTPGISQQDVLLRFEILAQKYFAIKSVALYIFAPMLRMIINELEKEVALACCIASLVNDYSIKFTEYRGTTFQIIDSKSISDDQSRVSVRFMIPGKDAMNVDLILRRTKTGVFKIVDVVAEGVSLKVTQRAGIDGMDMMARKKFMNDLKKKYPKAAKAGNK